MYERSLQTDLEQLQDMYRVALIVASACWGCISQFKTLLLGGRRDSHLRGDILSRSVLVDTRYDRIEDYLTFGRMHRSGMCERGRAENKGVVLVQSN